MGVFFLLLGILGIFVFLILLIAAAIKKKAKNKAFIGLIVSFVLIILGISLSGNNNNQQTPPETTVSETTNAVKEDIAPADNSSTPETTQKNEKDTASDNNIKWNTSETDPTKNGNIDLAVKLLKKNSDIKTSAVEEDPAVVIKMPWNYYGKALKFSGYVEVADDYPPNSDVSKFLDTTNSSDLVITSLDGTIIETFLRVSSGSVKVGDYVTVYGYAVGRMEVDNKLGGQFTHLILVGDEFTKE